MELFGNFIKVLTALQRHRVEYILVGGVAVIFYGMERLTRDIDLFLKMDAENVIRLRKALYSVFEDPAIEEITLEELQEYSVIRYGTPEDFYIDIMTHLGEMVKYEDLDYETIEYEGVTINIATPETLFQLKKDTLDAKFLEKIIHARNSKESN
jgi:hypothetical protein